VVRAMAGSAWDSLKRHMPVPRLVRFPAARVRQLRERLNLSQRDLADRIGVAERSVRRWEATPGTSNYREHPIPRCVAVLQELWDAADWCEEEDE